MRAERSSTVVYPVHGIAEIIGEETRTLDGQATTYVILLIAGDHRVDDLRILVEQDRFDEIGIRPAMSTETADDVLDLLAVANPRLSTTWARRYKNHQAKLKSGEVFDLGRGRSEPRGASADQDPRRSREGTVSTGQNGSGV